MSAKKDKARHLVVPGVSNWELWEYEGDGSAALKQTAENPAGLNFPPGSVICVPGGELCCHAMWLGTEDGGLLQGMADLRLEALGLAARGRADAVTALKRLKTVERKTLSMAVCHFNSSQSLKDVEYVAACTASFEAMDFEDNAVTLWRELGVLNAAVRFDSQVVAVQRMSVNTPGKSVAVEINCLLAELQMEEVIDSVDSLHVWDSNTVSAGGEIEQLLHLPVITKDRPAPVWPPSPVDLHPPRFRTEKDARHKRGKIARAGAALAAAAGLLLLLLVLDVLWLAFERSRLELGNQPLRPQVASVRDTSLRWQALSPALDADHSALELLYQVVRRLPPADVRLTLFQIKDGDLVVEGDSENVARIADFESGISKARELLDYTWKMPPPAILANNTAHFRMTGGHRQ